MSRITLVSAALGLLFILAASAHNAATPTFAAQALNRQESLAIGTLRSIASAEATFAAKYGRPGTLAELVEKRYLTERIKHGAELDGYRFGEVLVDASNQAWDFKAEPVDETQGKHAFNIVNDYTIRYQVGLIAPKGKSGKVLGTE
jgi:hypothetical protein